MGLKKKNSGSRGIVNALAVAGAGAIALYAAKVLINLYGPQPEFAINEDLGAALDSEEFIQFLSLVTDGTRRRSRVRRLKNGAEFYPEYLRAVRKAERAINLEFYEFLEGKVSRELVEALTERARAGVEVRVIVDALGSMGTKDRYFDELRAAGGQMCWYHPLRWNTWQEMNQRTHRKLLVIDGETGFVGGAGVADHWLTSTAKEPAWRDTMFCVEGEAVAGLISTFSENWLEASGEILAGPRQFGFRPMPDRRGELCGFEHAPRRRNTGTDSFPVADQECAEEYPHHDPVFFTGSERAAGADRSGRAARGICADSDRGAVYRSQIHPDLEQAQQQAFVDGRRGDLRVSAGNDPREADDGGRTVERGWVDQL